MSLSEILILNNTLSRYYKQLRDTSYYAHDKRGKFLAYFEENKFQTNDIIQQLSNNMDSENCKYITFDPSFPLKNSSKSSNKSQEIFNIIKFCFDYYHPPKPLLTINDYNLDIDENTMQIITNRYKLNALSYYQRMRNNTFIQEILSIGHDINNHNFILYLLDTIDRERVSMDNINKWLNNNKYLKQISNKNPTKLILNKIEITLRLIRRKCRYMLTNNPPKLIYDDMEQICHYLVNVSQFSNENKLAKPYMVELIFVTKSIDKPYSNIILPTDITSSDEDDEVQNDIMDFDGKTADKIGNIKDILKHEQCTFVADDIRYKEDIHHKLRNLYKEFKLKMNENDISNFPEMRRFCIIIDRRMNTDFDENIHDEMIIFDPPQNCNKLGDEYVPETYHCLTRQCSIPFKGYNKSDLLKWRNYHADSHRDGNLLTFSFHIESIIETRCYLYWSLASFRFYPQDIINILPEIFDKQYMENKNMQFIQSDVAKRIINGILIRDIYFEYFYQHLMDKKEDELMVKYKNYPWIRNTEYLVIGFLRTRYPEMCIQDVNILIVMFAM